MVFPSRYFNVRCWKICLHKTPGLAQDIFAPFRLNTIQIYSPSVRGTDTDLFPLGNSTI